jgi:hypothetical protein
MYLNALEFLEEEREAFRPYEALAGLSDAQLDVEVEGAHGWSGRDLMGHLVVWQEWALRAARDLAVGDTSTAMAELDELWEARGDAVNDDAIAEWRSMPMAEVRRRFGAVPGDLRGTLTVVPESRWVKDAERLRFFHDETTAHYADHLAELEAIIAAAG